MEAYKASPILSKVKLFGEGAGGDPRKSKVNLNAPIKKAPKVEPTRGKKPNYGSKMTVDEVLESAKTGTLPYVAKQSEEPVYDISNPQISEGNSNILNFNPDFGTVVSKEPLQDEQVKSLNDLHKENIAIKEREKELSDFTAQDYIKFFNQSSVNPDVMNPINQRLTENIALPIQHKIGQLFTPAKKLGDIPEKYLNDQLNILGIGTTALFSPFSAGSTLLGGNKYTRPFQIATDTPFEMAGELGMMPVNMGLDVAEEMGVDIKPETQEALKEFGALVGGLLIPIGVTHGIKSGLKTALKGKKPAEQVKIINEAKDKVFQGEVEKLTDDRSLVTKIIDFYRKDYRGAVEFLKGTKKEINDLPIKTPEAVNAIIEQKLLPEGSKFKNTVDPQGNVTREPIPTGDLTSSKPNVIEQSKKNIEGVPNVRKDFPQGVESTMKPLDEIPKTKDGFDILDNGVEKKADVKEQAPQSLEPNTKLETAIKEGYENKVSGLKEQKDNIVTQVQGALDLVTADQRGLYGSLKKSIDKPEKRQAQFEKVFDTPENLQKLQDAGFKIVDGEGGKKIEFHIKGDGVYRIPVRSLDVYADKIKKQFPTNYETNTYTNKSNRISQKDVLQRFDEARTRESYYGQGQMERVSKPYKDYETFGNRQKKQAVKPITQKPKIKETNVSKTEPKIDTKTERVESIDVTEEPTLDYVNKEINQEAIKKYGKVIRIEPEAFSRNEYNLVFESGHEQVTKIPKRKAVWDSYADAEKWLDAKYKEYGGKNEFLMSDEYKARYDEIKSLYDKKRGEHVDKSKTAMQEAGVNYGDRVEYFHVSPYGSSVKYTGVVVKRNGLPFVKFDKGQMTMEGKKSSGWNKGWKKEQVKADKPITQKPKIDNLSKVPTFDEYMKLVDKQMNPAERSEGYLNAWRKEHKKLVEKSIEKGKTVSDEVLKDYPELKKDPVFEQSKEYFGTTNNIKEAGYILPDGEMLDLSGKKQGGEPNTRALDHSEINFVDTDMVTFMDKGGIRFSPESNYFHISKEPTAKQLAVIKRIVSYAKGEVALDIKGMGLKDYQSVFGKEYNRGTKPEAVVKDIKDFFSGKEVKTNITNSDYLRNKELVKQAISKKSLDMSGLSKLVDMTDKKVLKATYDIAKYHFENGITKLGDFARQMVKDVGDWIKPHIKRLWEEVKAYATGDRAMLDPNTLGLFGGGSAKEFNLAKREGRTFEGKYDKKTRFELDDSKMKVKDTNILDIEDRYNKVWEEQLPLNRKWQQNKITPEELAKFDELTKELNRLDALKKSKGQIKIDDVVDYDELFKQYPELRNVKFELSNFPEFTGHGSYDRVRNTISVSKKIFRENPNEAKSIILHELQHVIQEIEGFARGSNPNAFKERNLTKEKYDKIEEQISEEWAKMPDEAKELWRKVNRKDKGWEEVTDEIWSKFPEQSKKYSDLRAEAYYLKRDLDNKLGYTLDPKEQYRRTAGEIEARDVQARMDYTKEQRRSIEPYSSENIPVEDAIVTYESEVSKLNAPKKEKKPNKVSPDRITLGEKESQFKPNEKTIHEDIRTEIKDYLAKDLDLMRELRRGKITDTQALKKATEFGVKIATDFGGDKFFETIKSGDVFPIEEHLGIVGYATKRLKDVMKDKTLTAQDRFNALQMYYKAEAISGELGRSLRGRQLIPRIPIEDIKGIAKDIADSPDIPKEQKEAVRKIAEDLKKNPDAIKTPNWYDKLRYIFYNAILSRPMTHARNIVGNTGHLIWEYSINPVSPRKVWQNADFKKTLKKVWDEGGDVSKFTEGQYEPKTKWVRNSMPTSWLKFEDVVFKEFAKGIQKTREAKSIAKEYNISYDNAITAIKNVLEGKTLKGEGVNKRLEKAVDSIEEYAKFVTFQKELGTPGTRLQSFLRSIPGSELIVPFVRTPANIMKVGLQPLKVLKYLTKEQRAKFKEMTPVEKRMEIRRITAGALMYVALQQLVANGVIEVTGQGANDKSKQDFMEKQGWKPNSIKIGNKYISYQNINPFNVGLGIIGNYSDGLKYNSKPKDDELNIVQKWSKTLAGFVATTTDQSFLRGLSDLANWQRTENPYYLEGFVNSFIPGVLSAVKDVTGDGMAYENKTVGEKISNRLGVTSGLKPRINVFGEQEKERGSGLPVPTPETPDELSKVLLDNNVTISYPKKDIIKADGQKVTDDEYYKFVKESGQRIKKALDKNFELIKTMEAGEMNKEIDRVVNSIRDDVKEEMFGKKENKKKDYKIKLK